LHVTIARLTLAYGATPLHDPATRDAYSSREVIEHSCRGRVFCSGISHGLTWFLLHDFCIVAAAAWSAPRTFNLKSLD